MALFTPDAQQRGLGSPTQREAGRHEDNTGGGGGLHRQASHPDTIPATFSTIAKRKFICSYNVHTPPPCDLVHSGSGSNQRWPFGMSREQNPRPRAIPKASLGVLHCCFCRRGSPAAVREASQQRARCPFLA